MRRAAAWSLGSQYASFAIQFGSSVIISRFYLVPADIGLFSIGLAAAMMISIFQDMGISRFVIGQAGVRFEHIRAYAAVAVALGWLVALVVALAAVPLARFYSQPQLIRLMLIIAAAYAVFPLGIVPGAMLTRAMDFRALFFANTSGALAGAIAAIGSAATGAGALSLAWGMLATALAGALIRIIKQPILPSWPDNLTVIRPILKFGGASFMISLSAAIGLRSQDLIIGRLLGMTATGLFTRASAVAGQLTMLMVGAMNAVFYPAFAKKRDAGEDLAAPYLHLIACNTALNWAAAIGLALAAEPAVLMLYGPNWIEVAPLLRWTALAEMFFVAMPLQMDIPILMGRINPLVRINLIDTLLTIVILAIFCLWGIETAAISRMVTGAIWLAIYAAYIPRLLDLSLIRLGKVYLHSGLCALAASLPMGAAQALGWFGPHSGLATLLLLSLAGLACWIATVLVSRHPASEELRLFIRQIASLNKGVAQA